MRTQQSHGAVLIPKETFECMIKDFGHILKDFENIMEQRSIAIVEKRLKDVKEGKVKGFTEKEFSRFLKRRV